MRIPPPQLAPHEVAMQLSYLNQPPTTEWATGTRPMGFFTGTSVGFRMQGATVMDHWKGLFDASEEIGPDEFREIVGDRNVAIPDSARLTRDMAARVAERYDREMQAQQYEQRLAGMVGQFAGGMVPWLVSPEGLAAFAAPPLRVGQVTAAAGRPMARAAAEGAAAWTPSALATMATNIMGQSSAYGDVDPLEASLAFGIPLAFGAAGRMWATARAPGVRPGTPAAPRPDEFVGPPRPDAVAHSYQVPPRLAKSFYEWAGVQAGDTTDVALSKMAAAMERGRVPADVMEDFLDAYVHHGMGAGLDSLSPQVQQAIRRAIDLDTAPIQRGAPEDIAAARALDKKIADAEARVLDAQQRMVEANRTPLIVRDGQKPTPKAPTRRQGEAGKKAQRDYKKAQETAARLREERTRLPELPEGALLPGQLQPLRAAAIREAAQVLSKHTDAPLPAEFVAAVMDRAALRAKVDSSLVNLPTTAAERGTMNASTAAVPDEVAHVLDTDPFLQALVRHPAGKNAIASETQIAEILKGCKL